MSDTIGRIAVPTVINPARHSRSPRSTRSASPSNARWLITQGTLYRTAWEQYQKDRDLPSLIAAVACVYATDPAYTFPAESIASQSNVLNAVAEANVAQETVTEVPK
jgi:flagellum-specific peptidoglycan hydrolase FlgJ